MSFTITEDGGLRCPNCKKVFRGEVDIFHVIKCSSKQKSLGEFLAP